ncbi:MAG: methionine biosynthesis protein MetW [Lentisphaeria bacterium]|nr:methionine biosynthesis protein MetW [Lentisphaerota bacterium]MBR7144903.1 methionine biosynthesis protein MetW [Lentisphaeria bacterium]
MKKNSGTVTPVAAEDMISRPDLRRIAELIEPGSRVLDLGCGNGDFLKYLKKRKDVRPLGVELDADMVAECVKQGIPVIHGDLNSNLNYLQDKSFDCVLLTRVLQELTNPEAVLREVVRIGRRGLVGFINFGHIRNRLQLAFAGRMPRNVALPHQWYNTPNIHLGTIQDFRELCERSNIEIIRSFPVGRDRSFLAAGLPNLFAYACIFEIRNKEE